MQLVHSMRAADRPGLVVCSLPALMLVHSMPATSSVPAHNRFAQPAHRVNVGLVILLHSSHVLGQVDARAVYNGGVRGALHLGVACRGQNAMSRGVV